MFSLFLSPPDSFKDSAQLRIFIGLIMRICQDESWLLNTVRELRQRIGDNYNLLPVNKTCKNHELQTYQLKNYLIPVGYAFSCIFFFFFANTENQKLFFKNVPNARVCVYIAFRK